jgi:hypothetical protein
VGHSLQRPGRPAVKRTTTLRREEQDCDEALMASPRDSEARLRIVCRGTVRVALPPERALRHFTAEGERTWVPGGTLHIPLHPKTTPPSASSSSPRATGTTQCGSSSTGVTARCATPRSPRRPGRHRGRSLSPRRAGHPCRDHVRPHSAHHHCPSGVPTIRRRIRRLPR